MLAAQFSVVWSYSLALSRKDILGPVQTVFFFGGGLCIHAISQRPSLSLSLALTLDGQSRAVVIERSLVRIIAAIRIASVR